MEQSTRSISELLSYRLSRVANTLTSSAAARYRRDFSVSIGEWRVLALLGQDGETTLNRLARRAALDKAQMSRVVKGLESRGLVAKKPGPRRSSILSLSGPGTDIYRRLIEAANDRDNELRAAVTPGALLVFLEVLDQLDTVARQMSVEETPLEE